MRIRPLTGALMLLCALFPLRAYAGTDEDRRAKADALFREGRALIDQGKYADACPKLAEAQELDPTAGTLLSLGDCYELNGQTASAWTAFRDAEMMARRAKNKPAADEAVRRATLVESKVATLVVEVATENLSEGFALLHNGKRLGSDRFNTPFPVDPGQHTIEATAPGKQARTEKFTIEAKPGLTRVNIPVLDDVPAAAAPVNPTPKPVSAPVTATPDQPTTGWSTQRTVGIVLGGVGVAGAVVGTVFGVLTLSKVKEAKDTGYCTNSDPPQCNQQAYDLHQQANTTANVSNVALAVGGAALVAGVVVFVTAPSGSAKTSSGVHLRLGPVMGTKTGGLSLRGEW